jgi:hypothetical protein
MFWCFAGLQLRCRWPAALLIGHHAAEIADFMVPIPMSGACDFVVFSSSNLDQEFPPFSQPAWMVQTRMVQMRYLRIREFFHGDSAYRQQTVKFN